MGSGTVTAAFRSGARATERARARDLYSSARLARRTFAIAAKVARTRWEVAAGHGRADAGTGRSVRLARLARRARLAAANGAVARNAGSRGGTKGGRRRGRCRGRGGTRRATRRRLRKATRSTAEVALEGAVVTARAGGGAYRRAIAARGRRQEVACTHAHRRRGRRAGRCGRGATAWQTDAIAADIGRREARPEGARRAASAPDLSARETRAVHAHVRHVARTTRAAQLPTVAARRDATGPASRRRPTRGAGIAAA